MVPGFGQQVEAVHLLVAQEHAPRIPADTLLHHGLPAAEPVEDFQRALGEADRTRAAGQPVVVVQQHHRDAGLRQIDGRRQPHQPGTDHHDRVAHRGRGVLVRAVREGKGERLVVDLPPIGHCPPPFFYILLDEMKACLAISIMPAQEHVCLWHTHSLLVKAGARGVPSFKRPGAPRAHQRRRGAWPRRDPGLVPPRDRAWLPVPFAAFVRAGRSADRWRGRRG